MWFLRVGGGGGGKGGAGGGGGGGEGAALAVFKLTSHGRMNTYLSAVLSRVEAGVCRRVQLKATGKAINKLVSVAEVVKRRRPGLHQVTEIGSLRNVDHYQPTEEGLKPVTHEKSISFMKVTLWKDPPPREERDKPGYQAPDPAPNVS